MPPQKKKADSLPDADWLGWFDGSAKPNPGACHLACILKGKENVVYHRTQFIGYGDSSDAEYQALITALELISQIVPCSESHRVLLRGDSQVVINDVLGPDHKASKKLDSYRKRARALIAAFPGITLQWIPRHQNTEVDELMRRDINKNTADLSV